MTERAIPVFRPPHPDIIRPPESQLNVPGATAIWENLLDYGSRQLVSQTVEADFLQLMADSPDQNGYFLIFGPSAEGKSTILRQLAHRLFQLNEDIKVEFISYDSEWIDYASRIHLEGREFTEDQKKELSAFMVRKILFTRLSPGTARLVEVPGIGENVHDRGRKVIEMMANIIPNSMIAGVFSGRRTSMISAQMRERVVMEIPEEEVERVLREEYNIPILGWEDGISDFEKGRRIKARFNASAWPREIRRIQKEVRRLIRRINDEYDFSAIGSDQGYAEMMYLFMSDFASSAAVPPRILYNPYYEGHKYWFADRFPPLE